MKKRIIALVLSILIILSATPLSAYAQESGVQIVKSGDATNFSKDAPISNVTIDTSKINVNNVSLLSITSNKVQKNFSINSEGYVYLEDCPVKNSYLNIGMFLLSFADAAVLPDGTRKTLTVKFADITIIGKSQYNEAYNDTLFFAHITGSGRTPVSFCPLSTQQRHVAIRSDITFRVDDANEGDTFLFSARSINVSRKGNVNFESIPYSANNYSFSESFEPISGIANGSDIYIPDNSCFNICDSTVPDSYGYRIVGNGTDAAGTDSFADGFATVADAKNGFTARAISSAGTNVIPVEIFFLADNVGSAVKTVADNNGSASLWADGTIDSECTEYAFGTQNAPKTYCVPGGKAFGVKVTPNDFYVINNFTVDGTAKTATGTIYVADGKEIDYYTYQVPAINENSAREIKSSFKRHSHTAAPSVIENQTTPTCTVNGGYDTVVYCAKCGDVISRRHTSIPATGHSYTSVVTKKPTCSAEGTEILTCTVCKSTKKQSIPKTAHTVVIDKAVEPTFATTGKTEGSHCSKCRQVIKAQQTVAKLGAPSISTLTAQSKGMKVTWRAVSNVGAYQIQYSTTSNFSSQTTVTVNGAASTSTTITKLLGNKTYYVRIRAYKTINSKRHYSDWSSAKTVTTKK